MLVVCCVLSVARSAGAQLLRAYVAASASAQWRDTFTDSGVPAIAPSVSAGGLVASRVAVEGSVVFPADFAFDWGYSYSDGRSLNRASVSDLMTIGYARVDAGCRGRLCGQPVIPTVPTIAARRTAGAGRRVPAPSSRSAADMGYDSARI